MKIYFIKLGISYRRYFTFFRDILRSDSQNSDAHVLRARILYLEGDNNKAVSHCQEALRCDPDNSKARVLLKVINFINEYNFIYYFNNFFFQ